MASAIELHDSRVRSCIETEGDVTICLSPAILHRSSGLAGRDVGDVFTLDLLLTLYDATIIEPFGHLPTALADGSVVVDNESFGNCIPYPLDVMAATKVEFGRVRPVYSHLSTWTDIDRFIRREVFGAVSGCRRMNANRFLLTQHRTPK